MGQYEGALLTFFTSTVCVPVEVAVGRLMAGNAIWLLEGGERTAETEEAVAE
jgi:hypothetical protein